jgi:hypothetical protein
MTLEQSTSNKRRWVILAAALLFCSAATGTVFAAWINNGPQIFLSLGSSALAWCF